MQVIYMIELDRNAVKGSERSKDRSEKDQSEVGFLRGGSKGCINHSKTGWDNHMPLLI